MAAVHLRHARHHQCVPEQNLEEQLAHMLAFSVAFIWALLPGSSRQKVTIRRAYAKVIGRMGDVICQILSYANCKEGPTKAPKVIINNLAALRARVNRTVQARAMARYELSLQGPWPSDLCESCQLGCAPHRMLMVCSLHRCFSPSVTNVRRAFREREPC